MHAVIKMTVPAVSSDTLSAHPSGKTRKELHMNYTDSGLTITSVMVSLEGTTVRPQQISQR